MKVLIAVDGSERSLNAARYAAGQFDPESTTVTLFGVSTEIPEVIWDLEQYPNQSLWKNVVHSISEEQSKRMADFTVGARTAFRDAGFPEGAVEARIRPIERGVARDILDESGHGYRAVVMGRKGVSRLEALSLGSVAQKVSTALRGLPLILVDRETRPDRILVAVDGSKGSLAAAEFAAVCAARGGRDITLQHVNRGIYVPEPRAYDTGRLRMSEEAWIEDHLRNVRPFLEQTRARLISAGFEPDRVKIKIDAKAQSRTEAVLAEARGGAFGTVAVGRRGHSEVAEHSMGRVTGKLLQLTEGLTIWIVG